MDTIFKTFRAEVKSVDDEDGVVEMLIPMSTGAMDRDGEVIQPMSFKKTLPKFKKRPVLLSSHDYHDLRKQIGEFQTLKVTEGGLLGKPKYYINEGNEEADWAFKLASKGMAAFSVGFIPKEWEDGKDDKSPRRTYTEVELLEISQVVVPANQEAIQGVRGKSVDPIVNKLLDEVEKSDLVTKPEAEIKVEEKHEERPVSQEALKDEIDYLKSIINQIGISPEVMPDAKNLVLEIQRITGSDIPETIKPKELNLFEVVTCVSKELLRSK